jgi:hypothetical protein
MKTKKLIKKMYKALLTHDKGQEKKLYLKALKKSLHHKNTVVIR